MTSEFAMAPRTASRPRLIAGVLVLIGGLSLAGCGSSAATAAPASAAPASAAPEATQAPAASAEAASTDPGSGAGDNSCGAETAALVQKTLNNPVIVRVSVAGGCHDAWIETTLDKSTVREALTICDAAAQIAYGPDISSITVTGKDDVELSIGIAGQDCIGEP